ncbi:hypothetical protein CVT26_000071 [Gymnopilus dilepis]|uniref:Uncharacterized protein n=1 Tax=Gymnopilus dilepis TaxID=231916 RepID=A0A409VGJ7_9AGAR|nr:hypothetical protein CVT26_000071 [Gymnopilus dilepis]
MQSLTGGEQYWAARALKAEALLTANHGYYKDVKAVEEVQDMKRERELNRLAQEYKEKHAALERLLIFLVGLIVLLIGVIIYLATHYARHSMHLQLKQHERWWSAIGASHFTIPILSPFTSVVEQETSVVGAKLLGTLAAVMACLGYFAFRHWLNKQSRSSTSLLTNVTNGASATISRSIDR